MRGNGHIISLLLLISHILLIGCRKDTKVCNDESDPNCPCWRITDANAEFGIYEGCSIENVLFEADTIFFDNPRVYLAAKKKNAKYEWTFTGLTIDTTLVDSVINLHGLLPQWGYVRAKLRVSQDIGNCKSVKSWDTLSKVFYCWGNYGSSLGSPPFPYFPIWGTYEGYYSSNPSAQVRVTLFDSIIYSGQFKNHCDSSGITTFPFPIDLFRGLPFPSANLSDLLLNTPGIVYKGNGASCAFIDVPEIIGRLQPFTAGCAYSKSLPSLKGYAWLDIKNSNKVYIQYTWKDTLDPLHIYNDLFIGYRTP